MQITVTDAGHNVQALELCDDTEISTLKELIAADFGIPPSEQVLFTDGVPLRSEAGTLREAALKEGSMLLVRRASPPPQQQHASRPSASRIAASPSPQRQTTAAPPPRPRGLLDFSSIVVENGKVAPVKRTDGVAEGAAASRRAPREAPLENQNAAAGAIPPISAAPSLARDQAEALVRACEADSAALGVLSVQSPALGEAVRRVVEQRRRGGVGSAGESGLPEEDAFRRLVELLQADVEARLKFEEERRNRLIQVQRDPLSREAQEFLLEQHRQARVEENYSLAQEHLPEGFGQVCMLYVPLELNGVSVKAFVDSGAQQSILSKAFAEKCGLDSLIDTRFRGTALGVGRAPILGRVHLAPLKIGAKFCPASFIVMDDAKMELMLGLDMLRRYQMCIDLKKNALVVEDEEIPFLDESQIDKGLFGNHEVEPPEETSSLRQPPTNAAVGESRDAPKK